MKRKRDPSGGRLVCFLVAALWPLLVGSVRAQPAAPIIQAEGGFNVPVFDERNQLRYLILGDSAAPSLLKGQLLVRQFRLETFRTNTVADLGKTNLDLIIQAPECLFDYSSASSSGKIQVRSADGQFALEGEGFVWTQAKTNALLVISNQVHTLVRRGTNAPVEIVADQFRLDTQNRVVTYLGHVRAEDPQMYSTCGALTVSLRAAGGSFESIVAETDVVVVGKAEDSRATGGRAVYTQATEQIEVTEAPTWKLGPRAGSADKLVLDRRERSFAGSGHGVLQLPKDQLRVTDLLQPATDVTPPRAPGPVAELKLFADDFVARSNLTVLRGHVRVLDATNELTCGVLTLQGDPAPGKEHTLTAEDHVVVAQGARQVTAGKAVYASLTDTVVFTEHPEWSLDGRTGHAETLTFDRTRNRLHAGRNVFLNLPRGAAGGRKGLLPGFQSPTGGLTTDVEALEIEADDLEITPGLGRFRGQVRVGELPAGPRRQRLTCGTLDLEFTTPGNQIQRVIASEAVVIEQGIAGVLKGPTAYQRMTCDRLTARMLPGGGNVDTVVAEERVVFDHAATHVEGARAVFTGASNQLELTGHPTARTPQLVITEADALVWDRLTNRIAATGNFKMELFSDALQGAKLPGRKPKLATATP